MAINLSESEWCHKATPEVPCRTQGFSQFIILLLPGKRLWWCVKLWLQRACRNVAKASDTHREDLHHIPEVKKYTPFHCDCLRAVVLPEQKPEKYRRDQ